MRFFSRRAHPLQEWRGERISCPRANADFRLRAGAKRFRRKLAAFALDSESRAGGNPRAGGTRRLVTTDRHVKHATAPRPTVSENIFPSRRALAADPRAR
jgi:hypothetical protein